MIVALAAITVVALLLVLATDLGMLRLQERHRAFVAELLEEQARERHSWAHERWELNTRLQAPEVARVAPPAPPAPPAQDDDVEARDEDDVDESHLVGMSHG